MRLSSLETDPGFDAWQELNIAGRVIRVFLDDIEIEDVETADEEAGTVTVLARDSGGDIVVVDGEIVRQARAGRVRIEIGEGKAP